MAVMKSSKGKTAYVNPEGDVSVENRATSFRGLRKPNYRLIWKEGLRGLFLKKGWHIKGGSAKRTTSRDSIMARVIKMISYEYICAYELNSAFPEEAASDQNRDDNRPKL